MELRATDDGAIMKLADSAVTTSTAAVLAGECATVSTRASSRPFYKSARPLNDHATPAPARRAARRAVRGAAAPPSRRARSRRTKRRSGIIDATYNVVGRPDSRSWQTSTWWTTALASPISKAAPRGTARGGAARARRSSSTQCRGDRARQRAQPVHRRSVPLDPGALGDGVRRAYQAISRGH